MTPQELKNSILQLAIQGKLVEQRPEEGTALDLLAKVKQIDTVDGQRIKQKNITEITEEDKSFELPETWAWIKLGSICTIARGGSPRPIEEYLTTAEDGINWIKIGDTEKNGKYISSTKEKIKPSGISRSRMVHAGDFLLTNSMSFGRPYILKTEGCIHDGWLVISQGTEIFDQDFLYWTLSSNYAYSQFCGKVSGAVVKNLNSDKVANSVFPLPPLAEQKRIVAKIEELLPLIDRYGAAWSRLEDFNKRFPNDMQKSILQMAIQGKLVEQRPEEGTAEALYKQIQSEKQSLIKAGKLKKEKSLPPITDDEKPFDIPDSWKWVRLPEIGELNRGKSQYRPRNAPELYTNGKYPFIQTGDVAQNDYHISQWDTMYNEKGLAQSRLWPKGTLCLTIAANIGDVAILDFDACFPDSVVGFNAYFPINSNLFIMYGLMCYKNYLDKLSRSTAQKNINLEILSKVAFPLPPLAEQKRIVAKIEELLPLCERLK